MLMDSTNIYVPTVFRMVINLVCTFFILNIAIAVFYTKWKEIINYNEKNEKPKVVIHKIRNQS